MAGAHQLRAEIIVSGKADQSLLSLGNQIQSWANQIRGVSNAAMEFAEESLETYRNYEDGILETRSVLQSTYGNTKDLNAAMDSIEQHAQNWAETTIFGTADVANAIANAAHAGWDYDKIIQGIPASMLIAQAGGLELADGVDYMTKMMAASGTQFEQSTNFVNEWAKAADMAATDIKDIGEAFVKLGTASRLAGSNEELFTMMSILANSGTTGATAGTALRNVMARIAAPTGKAQEAMEALGISEEEAAEAMDGLDDNATAAYQRLVDMGFSAYDAQGKLRPMIDIFKDMNTLMSGMDEKSKNDFLRQLFGTKSFQYAMTLLDAANSGELMSVYEAILGVKDSDYAQEKADTLMSGLTGSIAIMESKWEEFQRKIGENLSGPVETGIGFINSIVDVLNGADPKILDGITGVIGTLAVAYPAIAGVATAIKVIGFLGVGGAFAWISGAAAGIGALITLHETLEEKFKNHFGDMELDTDPLNNYLNGVNDSFTSLKTNADAFNEAMKDAITNYTETGAQLSSDLLTAMITGTTLTQEQIDTITGLGGDMRKYLIDGIANTTAATMSWYEALFSYGGEKPTDSDAYNDIILSLSASEHNALGKAEELGYQLGQAIANAVKDGVISANEYDIISSLMDEYDAAIEKYTNADRAGKNAQQMNEARKVSWDSFSDWANSTWNSYQNTLNDMDDENAYNRAFMKESYLQNIADGVWNPKEGRPYRKSDLVYALLASDSKYNSARDYYTQQYNDVMMRGVRSVLESGGMWDAFNYLWNYTGDDIDADAINAISENPELAESFKNLSESAAWMSSTLQPWLRNIDPTKDYSQMVTDAMNIVDANNAYRDELETSLAQRWKEGLDASENPGQYINYDDFVKGFDEYIRNNPEGDVTGYFNKTDQNGYYDAENDARFNSALELLSTIIQPIVDVAGFYMGGTAVDDAPVVEKNTDASDSFLGGTAVDDAPVVEKNTDAADSFLGVLSTIIQPFVDVAGFYMGGTAYDDTPANATENYQDVRYGAGVALEIEEYGNVDFMEQMQQEFDGFTVNATVDVTDNGTISQARSQLDSIPRTIPVTAVVTVSGIGSVASAVKRAAKKTYAEGGRADEASIFGEAGPEWAIPEQHSERTAELLYQAAEASGFTWPELLSMNGGLNAGTNGSGASTLVYSPTINVSGSGDDLESVLKDDKDRLEKWWRERELRESTAVYA